MSTEEIRNTRIVMNVTEILNCVLLWGGSVCTDAKERIRWGAIKYNLFWENLFYHGDFSIISLWFYVLKFYLVENWCCGIQMELKSKFFLVFFFIWIFECICLGFVRFSDTNFSTFSVVALISHNSANRFVSWIFLSCLNSSFTGLIRNTHEYDRVVICIKW